MNSIFCLIADCIRFENVRLLSRGPDARKPIVTDDVTGFVTIR